MKSDSENIPAIIFDWLEKYNFSSLDAAQQEEMLSHISQEEYTELRQSVLTIKSAQQNSGSTANGSQKLAAERRVLRKQELLNSFDSKHRKPAKAYMLLSRPVALWKAAAVFILFGAGWMTHYLLKEKSTSNQPILAAVDTIYVTKEVTPALEKIYDTVYIRQHDEPATLRKVYLKQRFESTPSGNEVRAVPREMNVLSIKETDTTPNRQKGQSIKDDSLLKKYPFVSIL